MTPVTERAPPNQPQKQQQSRPPRWPDGLQANASKAPPVGALCVPGSPLVHTPHISSHHRTVSKQASHLASLVEATDKAVAGRRLDSALERAIRLAGVPCPFIESGRERSRSLQSIDRSRTLSRLRMPARRMTRSRALSLGRPAMASSVASTREVRWLACLGAGSTVR